MRLTVQRARKAINYWRRVFGLDPEWLIETRINYVPDPGVDADKQRLAAFIEPEPGYLQASLTLNAYNIRSDEVDETIAHELLHIVLAEISEVVDGVLSGPLQAVANTLIEHTTTMLTNAFMRLKKGKVRR